MDRNCSGIVQTGAITPQCGRQERSGVSAERRQYRLLSTTRPEQLQWIRAGIRRPKRALSKEILQLARRKHPRCRVLREHPLAAGGGIGSSSQGADTTASGGAIGSPAGPAGGPSRQIKEEIIAGGLLSRIHAMIR